MMLEFEIQYTRKIRYDYTTFRYALHVAPQLFEINEIGIENFYIRFRKIFDSL